MTQSETQTAQVKMITPGSSRTRTISQELCRTKVQPVAQCHQLQ